MEIPVGSVPDVVNDIVPLNMAEPPLKLWFESLKLIIRCLNDATFEQAFSRNIRGANFVEIRQLYDNSKSIAVFHDNMTKGTTIITPLIY